MKLYTHCYSTKPRPEHVSGCGYLDKHKDPKCTGCYELGKMHPEVVIERANAAILRAERELKEVQMKWSERWGL